MVLILDCLVLGVSSLLFVQEKNNISPNLRCQVKNIILDTTAALLISRLTKTGIDIGCADMVMVLVSVGC